MPRGPSFSAADRIDFPADDGVAEAVFARLNVIEEVEGRGSQFS
jgi:hypothetical protein